MWLKYKLETEKTYSALIFNRQYFLRKEAKTWKLAEMPAHEEGFSENGFTPAMLAEDSFEWNYFVGDKQNTLQVSPALPDRPLVLKPDSTLKILPGMNSDIYVKIPVWIQFYNASQKEENLFFEQAVVELSSTWFGDPDNGILAYSMPGSFSHSPYFSDLKPWEAVCHINIKNETSAILDFQRFLVRANELTLYKAANMLSTNEVRVRFRGEDQTNDEHLVGGSPSYSENAKQINGPRIQPGKGLLSKSFHFIKSVTQY